MTNPRLKQQLERISNDLGHLLKHVVQYSGIAEGDAVFVDNLASEIAETAARIGAEARRELGDRTTGRLVKNVRKSLGYTKP